MMSSSFSTRLRIAWHITRYSSLSLSLSLSIFFSLFSIYIFAPLLCRRRSKTNSITKFLAEWSGNSYGFLEAHLLSILLRSPAIVNDNNIVTGTITCFTLLSLYSTCYRFLYRRITTADVINSSHQGNQNSVWRDAGSLSPISFSLASLSFYPPHLLFLNGIPRRQDVTLKPNFEINELRPVKKK